MNLDGRETDEVKEQLFILRLEEKQTVDYLPQFGRVKQGKDDLVLLMFPFLPFFLLWWSVSETTQDSFLRFYMWKKFFLHGLHWWPCMCIRNWKKRIFKYSDDQNISKLQIAACWFLVIRCTEGLWGIQIFFFFFLVNWEYFQKNEIIAYHIHCFFPLYIKWQ